jgi:hypothetical protein
MCLLKPSRVRQDSPRLAKRSFVAADNPQPWKARILLSLAVTNDAGDVQRIFDTY